MIENKFQDKTYLFGDKSMKTWNYHTHKGKSYRKVNDKESIIAKLKTRLLYCQAWQIHI